MAAQGEHRRRSWGCQSPCDLGTVSWASGLCGAPRIERGFAMQQVGVTDLEGAVVQSWCALPDDQVMRSRQIAGARPRCREHGRRLISRPFPRGRYSGRRGLYFLLLRVIRMSHQSFSWREEEARRVFPVMPRSSPVPDLRSERGTLGPPHVRRPDQQGYFVRRCRRRPSAARRSRRSTRCPSIRCLGG